MLRGAGKCLELGGRFAFSKSTPKTSTEAWTNALEPEWSTSRRFRTLFGLKRLKMMSFSISHHKPRTSISPHAKCIPRRADHDAALKTAVRAIPIAKLTKIARKSRLFQKIKNWHEKKIAGEATFPARSPREGFTPVGGVGGPAWAD